MKVQLLFTAFLLSGFFYGYSQITVTDANIAPIGTDIQLSSDSLPTVTPGPAGANQTWNLTALNNHTVRTITVITPSSAPSGSLFSASNLAVSDNGDYFYAKNISSGFYIDGYDVTGFGTIDFQPDYTFITFPSTYQTSYSSPWGYNFTFYYGQQGIDSINVITTATSNSLIDGWGNVTTPFGTFSSLRQYEVTYYNQDVFGYVQGFGWMPLSSSQDSSFAYRWWTNHPNAGYPLVDMSYDPSTSSVVSAEWMSGSTASVSENPSSGELKTFPNPALKHINIMLGEDAFYTIDVYDMTGAHKSKHEIKGEKAIISTEGFAAGTYFYLLRNETGNFQSGKFVVK